jgi:hypothetical protein
VGALLAMCGGACAGVASQAAPSPGRDAAAGLDAPGAHDALGGPDLSVSGGGERPPPAPGRVYAHSATTLYLLEPISKQVTVVGDFDCGGSMVDLAVDKGGRMTGSAAIARSDGSLGGQLVSIDPTTAHCQVIIQSDNLITSLTYVPAGTLLPNTEALVGYDNDLYMQVNPTTGALTQVGVLNDAASGGTHWVSSGDIVSVTGGGTYLTVVPQGGPIAGGDRIVEVDPKTGALTRIIGPTGKDAVLGLGYWGGVAYGFTEAGELIQIDLATGAGTDIPIPNAGSDLSFLGAGTTTIAPLVIID